MATFQPRPKGRPPVQPKPVAHIGILVRHLESSRRRWQTVLGAPFSPITRYRPENWSDLGNPEPHLHDARLTFYLGDAPSIEILEFVGNGTHSPEKGEGGHHLSFPPLEDNSARRAELAGLGVGIDGEIWHDGRWIFQFAEATALNNVYTEWVEEHPDHPDVKDDLSPINRLPDGTKTLFDVETILALGGHRPASGITEIGIAVHDLAQAKDRWAAVIGYEFVDADGNSALGGDFPTRLRLLSVAPQEKEGLRYAVVSEPELGVTADRLRAAEVPITEVVGEGGRLAGVHVDPGYLNGFGIRFVSEPTPS